MKFKFYLFYFPILFLLLNFSLANLIIEKNSRFLINFYSEIHLVVNAQENKNNKKINLLYQQFQVGDFEVYVNGNKDESCDKQCKLSEDRIKIDLIFKNKINTCELMFNGLKNIIEVDLSDFDTSEVKSMKQMFYDCTKLEKIKFGKVNTSSVENMESIFDGCSELTSIDLSYLDTSKVTTMKKYVL